MIAAWSAALSPALSLWGALLAPPGLTGFVQTDWVSAQDSVDQLADGSAAPLNRDGFTLRRARLRWHGETPRVGYVLEAELNTVDGLAVLPRRVEGSIGWCAERGPLDGLDVRLSAGLFPVPFGHQIIAPDRDRHFTERAAFADALFPGQLDTGARLDIDWAPVHLVVAIQNGEPLATTAWPEGDPNAAKDLTARVSAVGSLGERVRLSGGLSVLSGTGFHPGVPPSKEQIQWRDLNEDGVVQTSEISALPPASGTPAEDFERWGVGADLQVQVQTGWGPSRLLLEGVIANNLDRGLRPADPLLLGRDQRALGAMVGLTQGIGSLTLGARIDTYRPALDASETRAGGVVRAEERFEALTATVAWQVSPRPLASRLTVEYQRLADRLARDDTGAPTDLANDRITARLQVGF